MTFGLQRAVYNYNNYQYNQRVYNGDMVKVNGDTDYLKSASQDAAKLLKSEKIRLTISNLSSETSAIQAGITKDQILEGGIVKSQEIIHKMTTLSVNARDSEISQNDRFKLHQELRELAAKLDTIAAKTTFEGKGLFDNTEDETLSESLGIKDVPDMETADAANYTVSLESAEDYLTSLKKNTGEHRISLENKLLGSLDNFN